MSFLAIDVGNTNVVCAVYDGDWTPQVRLDTKALGSASQLASQLGGMLTQWGVAPESAGLACVVPKLSELVLDAIAQGTQCSEVGVVDAPSSGLNFVLPDPSIVGADRLANAAAAREQYGAPVLVVDFGTATTFEYVAENGTYLSGPIVAGLELQQGALSNAAAQLTAYEWNDDVPVFVEDTVTALQSGLLYSTVGAVDHILDTMLDEVEVEAQIIATGGLAERIAPNLAHEITVDPYLTLSGIRYICNR